MVDGLTVIAGQTITNVKAVVPVQPFLSVAVTDIGKLPVCVGVPDNVPFEKVIPVGSVPLSVNVIVPRPPLWPKVPL